MFTVSEVLVEVPITEKIQNSNLSPVEKEQFLNLLCYFTPEEIEALRDIL